ncbi:hypothetical protein pipiens_009368 [Culex pipiens pipiens]|uniref:Odorant receptor n=1 Tax=Culex pipiens pipiens TaxID=38569 RepID=A0ABD1DE24_CULPP
MEFLRRRFLCWRNGLESEFSSAKKLFEKACHSVTQYIWVCGCERFEPNFTRWNARFVFLMVNICVFMAVSFWSLTVLWGQRVEFIFCCVTIGIGVQGFVKAYMYSHDTIYELLQYNLKRFENTKGMPEIHHSLIDTASLCTASVKLIGPCYASMGAFTILISIVISLYYGRFELPFGFYLPGLDRATWIGYLLNLAFHILQVFEAVTGLLAADMCFFNLMINAIGQLDVMIIYLKKLGNDELIREVYNAPWNELPIPAQKALGMLLQFAQNPVILSDGFAPIDLDSFLEIYKKIYSYLAMIQNIN